MDSMYAYIKGELAEKNIDSIVVEAAGVGYLIYIPTQYFDMLPDEGENVKIYTYLCVREDAMILYGFLSKDDLEIFKLLITVSGIGPKGGLAILSTLPADDLRFAILSGDSKAISKAPGIGAKTAQRVILDLKDKLSLEDAFEKKLENQTSGAVSSMNSTVKNDAVMALNALGYSSTESLKAVSKVDLEIFKLLITVSGIGPKGGLAILSTLPADDLRFAILSGDSKAISKAPGIGAKTAQRVILDLKDKLSLEDAFEKKLENQTSGAVSSMNSTVKNDAVMALNALGYSSTESLKAVSKVDITEDMDVEDVLKLALKNMG